MVVPLHVKGTVLRDFFYFLHKLAPPGHLIQWLQVFPKFLKMLRAIQILKFVPVESRNTDLKKWEESSFQHFFWKALGVNRKMRPELRKAVPFQGREAQKIVLLLGIVAILPRCCPRRWKLFRFVAQNAEKCSSLPTRPIIFPRTVVGNNTEKSSNLSFVFFPRIWNHMRI
jgi:hypothetical protein